MQKREGIARFSEPELTLAPPSDNAPDPRLVEFVRLPARRAAKERYEQIAEGHRLKRSRAYGYDVFEQFQANGEPTRGDRVINPAEAEVVRRLFRDNVVGRPAKLIAAELNKDGIPAPGGIDWGFSTINGNAKRGNGVLNNEMYIGRIVWNRQRFTKNPEAGARRG